MQPIADRLADARARRDAVVDRRVQQPAGLLGHAEPAGAERLVDVLRRRAAERDLEVVNDARRRSCASAETKPRSIRSIEDRRQPGLDDVRAEAPDDSVARRPRRTDRA